MFELRGGCHCGNLQLILQLSQPPGSYRPRACDCDFCVRHGAAYVSDPEAVLTLRVNEMQLLSRYRQGSESAECLICSRCGVLVAVMFQEGTTVLAAVNGKAIEGPSPFGEIVPVSPKSLAPAEKVARWRKLWTSKVKLVASVD